jgi:hypothetical protein
VVRGEGTGERGLAALTRTDNVQVLQQIDSGDAQCSYAVTASASL